MAFSHQAVAWLFHFHPEGKLDSTLTTATEKIFYTEDWHSPSETLSIKILFRRLLVQQISAHWLLQHYVLQQQCKIIHLLTQNFDTVPAGFVQSCTLCLELAHLHRDKHLSTEPARAHARVTWVVQYL